jgi:hypothetical protein
MKVMGALRRIGLHPASKSDSGYVVKKVQKYAAVSWNPVDDKHLKRMAFIKMALEIDGFKVMEKDVNGSLVLLVLTKKENPAMKRIGVNEKKVGHGKGTRRCA